MKTLFPKVNARTAIRRTVACYLIALACIALAATPLGVLAPLVAALALGFSFYCSMQESLGDDGMALGLLGLMFCPCIMVGVLAVLFTH